MHVSYEEIRLAPFGPLREELLSCSLDDTLANHEPPNAVLNHLLEETGTVHRSDVMIGTDLHGN